MPDVPSSCQPLSSMPPRAGVTPAALRRLSAMGMASTPPMASATRQPMGSGMAAGAGTGGSMLTAPEGETSSRVPAMPELLPVPYTQRLHLPAAARAAAPGEGPDADGEGAGAAAASGGSTAAAGDAEAGDGMENLTQQVRGAAAGD